MRMDYIVKRSDRRTVSVTVDDDGRIIVKAGRGMSRAAVDRFVESSAPFIARRLREIEAVDKAAESMGGAYTGQQISDMKARARVFFTEKASLYADLLGVSFSGISVKTQTTLWGSCSAKGILSFNCLLMDAPLFVAASVAAHEVCHLRHRDHGKAFYSELRSVFPEYDKAQKWLRLNGRVLMRRLKLYLETKDKTGKAKNN